MRDCRELTNKFFNLNLLIAMQVAVIISATVKENIGGLHIGCKTLYRQLLDEDIA